MGTDSHEAKNRKYFGSKSAVCLASGVSTSFTPLSGTKGVDFAAVGGIVNGHNVINVNVLALNECVPVLVLSKKWALVRDVVEAVCFALGVHEHWYFGLTLSTHDQLDTLLAKDKRLFDLADPEVAPKLSFVAHFYPEDCSNIIQSISVDLIFYEVSLRINQSSILCPTERLAELGALCLAVLYPLGDGKDYFDAVKCKIVPQVHLENVSAQKLLSLYESILGKSPADYKRNYLKRAQDLRMYGSTYFNVTSISGDKWNLCVDSKGLALCLPTQTLEPFAELSWFEIKSTCYKDCKFTLVLQPGCQRSFQVSSGAKVRSSSAAPRRKVGSGAGNEVINESHKEIVFFTAKKTESRQIMYMLAGNHELYHRHRKNQSIETKFMRKREQRTLLNMNAAFEQLKLLSAQVSTMKEDLSVNNEEKERLKRDLEASLVALRRVQTAAACLENNCSSFAEENYLLRSYIQNIPPHRSVLEYQSRAASARSTPKKVSSTTVNSSEERNVHSQSPHANNLVDRNHNLLTNDSRPRLYGTHNGITVTSQSNWTNTSHCLSGYGKSSSVQELRPTTLASKVYPQYSFNLPRHTLHTTMVQSTSNGLMYPQPSSVTQQPPLASSSATTHTHTEYPPLSSSHYANLYPSYAQCLNVNTSSSVRLYQNMPIHSDNQANASLSVRPHQQQSFQSSNQNRLPERQPNEYENTTQGVMPNGTYLPDGTTGVNNRSSTPCGGFSGIVKAAATNNTGVNSAPSIPSSHILPNRPDLLATSRTFESNSSTPLTRSRLAAVRKTSGNRKANSLDRLNNDHATVEEKMPTSGRRSYGYINLRPSSSLTGAAFFGQRDDEERI